MAATLSIEIKETGTSVANNTSTVSVVVKITTTGSWNLYSPYGQITFSGNLSGTYGWNHGFDKYATTTLWSKTFTVSHDADGTGSVSASAYVDTNVSPGRIHANASLTLTTIPRASKPTVSGSNHKLGSPITINTNRASGAFTHTVKWSWADGSGTIATDVGASTVWTPPLSLASYLPASTYETCTITVNTYNGSTLIGTNTTSFRLSIPDSVKPSISSVALSDSSQADEGFGVILAGVSNLTAAISASSMHGAAIVKAAVKFGDVYKEFFPDTPVASGTLQVALGVMTEVGDQAVTVTVTDSRARQATYNGSGTVYAYSAPDLSGTTAYRYDAASGTENDESQAIRVRIKGKLSEPGEGVASIPANSADVKVQWMQRGGDAWTTEGTNTKTGTFDYAVDLTGTFSELSSFLIRVTATDKSGTSTTMELAVASAKPVIDLKATGDGIALLGISTKKGIQANDIIHLTQDAGIDIENESGASQAFLRMQANGRPTIMNHMGIANGMWIQGRLSSGSFANILRMSETDGLELNWPSGGVGGRVRKTLWEGTWSYGQDALVTISEAAYYNFFLATYKRADFSTDQNIMIPLFRRVPGDVASRIAGGATFSNGYNTMWTVYVEIASNVTNRNQFSLVACDQMKLTNGSVTGFQHSPLLKLEGIL